jgi:uncharacterized protein YhfF
MATSDFEVDASRPVAAKCNNDRLFLTLADGREISAPLWWHPFLEKAAAEDRAKIEFELGGVWWPSLDEGISVKAMLLGWKSHDAIDPNRKIQTDVGGQPPFLSAGIPVPSDWDGLKVTPTEPAAKVVRDPDYRSLIHERVSLTYELGRRYLKEFDYDRFFAATDTLQDVGDILHVAKTARWPSDETIGYLWMYGVLQALVVEQEATYQLMQCFKISKHASIEQLLKPIRDLRVSAVGHPSKHDSTDIKGCTFLSHRDFSSRSKFRIVTLQNFDNWVHQTVDVLNLIASQRSALNSYLRSVWCAVKHNPVYDKPVSFSFGDSPKMADELLGLVISGVKTATCGALRDYLAGSNEMPVVGRRDVVMNGEGRSAALIETLEVTIRSFDEVDESFAHDEGEGFRTLAEWRKGHQAYFERNGGFSPDMELVCERFKLVEVL